MCAWRGLPWPWFDDVLIRKDGRFLPEELQCLNPENLLSEEQEDA